MRGIVKSLSRTLKVIMASHAPDELRQNTPPDERDVDADETRAAMEGSSGQREETHTWHLARN
jgi:hypothetical protein